MGLVSGGGVWLIGIGLEGGGSLATLGIAWVCFEHRSNEGH